MANAATFFRQRLWRASLLVLLTVCLHIFIVDWGNRQLASMAVSHDKDVIINVTLREIPRPTEAVKLPVSAPPSSQKPGEKTSSATPKITDDVSRLSMNDTAAALAENQPHAVNEVPVDTSKPDADEHGNVLVTQGIYYRVDPPPSAAVSYAVEAIQNTLTYRAMGSITWHTDGKTYTIRGEATSLFITLLAFNSEGSINEFGISPSLYTEQRIRKPVTSTYFSHSNNDIHFSSSDVTYSRNGGEQDRASLVWQLASIGRGDADQFFAGAVIDLFVAGVRDGEVWRVQVIGQEELATAIGHLTTWHVVRQPRIGSYDQRIDIWFAPEKQWYPIKLRYTEPNADYLDMSITSIKLLQ